MIYSDRAPSRGLRTVSNLPSLKEKILNIIVANPGIDSEGIAFCLTIDHGLSSDLVQELLRAGRIRT